MFEKKKILIVRMGYQRDDASFIKAAKHKSKLMDITLKKETIKLDSTLKAETSEVEKTYKHKEAVYDCKELLGVLLERNIADYDLVFAFVDRPLDITFVPYENCVLVSTDTRADTLKQENISLSNYIISTIYGVYTRKYLGINPPHHESPGCLLDFNYLERDLIMCCARPRLCEGCEDSVADEHKAAVKQMNKELKKIRIPLYIRIMNIIKKRTILSMLVAVVASLFLGVLSNLIAAWSLKGIWQIVVVSAVPLVILFILVVPFVVSQKRK